MRLGDGEAIAVLGQGDLRLGVHFGRGETGIAQYLGQSHGEAARMGRADQFFGIGAGTAFKAGDEAIGMILEGATLGRDCADAVLQSALPDSAAIRRHSCSPCCRPGPGLGSSRFDPFQLNAVTHP